MNTIAAGNSASVKRHRVLVKGGTVENRTGADPSFKLESSLNRLSFVDGDEMKITIPDETDKRKGIKLVLHMLDNKIGSESIYILALKQPFSYNAARFREGIYGVYDGNTAFMNGLVQEIVGIPLQDRAEKFMQYQIRKDKGGGK